MSKLFLDATTKHLQQLDARIDNASGAGHDAEIKQLQKFIDKATGSTKTLLERRLATLRRQPKTDVSELLKIRAAVAAVHALIADHPNYNKKRKPRRKVK